MCQDPASGRFPECTHAFGCTAWPVLSGVWLLPRGDPPQDLAVVGAAQQQRQRQLMGPGTCTRQHQAGVGLRTSTSHTYYTPC